MSYGKLFLRQVSPLPLFCQCSLSRQAGAVWGILLSERCTNLSFWLPKQHGTLEVGQPGYLISHWALHWQSCSIRALDFGKKRVWFVQSWNRNLKVNLCTEIRWFWPDSSSCIHGHLAYRQPFCGLKAWVKMEVSTWHEWALAKDKQQYSKYSYIRIPPSDLPLLSYLFVYPDSRWMVLVFLASNTIEATKQLLRVESYRPFPPSYGDGCRCPGSWSFDYKRCRRLSSLMCLRSIPSKLDIDPEKWRLENDFPFRKVTWSGLC